MPEPPDANKIGREYGMRTVMFGDGQRGSAMQMHSVTYGGQPTGIITEWRRAHRHDPGKITVNCKDKVYPSVVAAIAAYEEDHPELE